MKKLHNKITAVIVAMFIASFLILTVLREKGTESYQENRRLAAPPELSFSSLADGSFVQELGNYMTDHFAGRSFWISAKGAIEANIGERSVNGVYITDGMLLNSSSCTGRFTEKNASEINKFSDSYDGAVYFAAVPSSSGVYGDILPEQIAQNTEKQQIELLYSSLGNNIRKIDAYGILKLLNDNYIYYRNDSRWTSYGAYCVYRTVIQKLGFLPSAYDKYTIEHVSGDFRGNLYNRTQYKKIKADILDVYTYNNGADIISCIGYNNDGTSFEKKLYDKSYIGTHDMYKLYLGDNAPLVKINTSVNNDRKLLVIKDSYADCFIPFLVQHYSEIAIVSPDGLDNGMISLVNKEDYAQTLFLFGIETISEEDYLESINK